jgi:hypothetical protein
MIHGYKVNGKMTHTLPTDIAIHPFISFALGILLDHYHVINERCYKFALKSIFMRADVQDVWIKQYGLPGETVEMTPPLIVTDGDNLIEYSPPNELWQMMGKDTLDCMEVLMLSIKQHGLAPEQCDWQCLLHTEVDMLDSSDRAGHDLAMVVCLHLSPASHDRSCIKPTSNLYRSGLLLWEELAAVS